MDIPTISLCIISRKEDEGQLKRCIDSFREYVDEIIVVDTSEGISIDGVTCVPFTWVGDFSKARNFSFEQATQDYIIWADSDDELQSGEKLSEVVQNMADRGIDWGTLPYNYGRGHSGLTNAGQMKTRIVKNDGKSSWHKSVHENLEHDGQYIYEDYQEPVIFHHYDNAKHFEKELRNYRILKAEYEQDKEDTDLRTIHYLGKSSMGLGMAFETSNDEREEYLKQALFFFRWHFDKAGWDDERYFSLVYSGLILAYMSRGTEAQNAFLQATRLIPHWSDAYWYLCKSEFDLEHYSKAVQWGEIAWIKSTPQTVLSKNDELNYWTGPATYIRALLLENQVQKAHDTALKLSKMVQGEKVEELLQLTIDAAETENYVGNCSLLLREAYKRNKKEASRLAEAIPDDLLSDIRIQNLVMEIKLPHKWEKDSLVFFCGRTSTAWAAPSVLTGIGGSEEAVIYLAKELAKKGKKVTVYCYCGDLAGTYEGVEYKNYWHFNPNDYFQHIIVWRSPQTTLYLKNARKIWLWLHDITYDDQFSEAILAKTDKVLFLSEWARSLAPSVPDDKVLITNNGILPEQFTEKDTVRYQCVYASSYDRGLEVLLEKIAPKIYAALPDFTLKVAYGWNNFDAIHSGNEEKMAWKEHMEQLLQQPFVEHLGRIGHQELADLFAQSEALLYPTEFGETNCITAQKAQAANCYVISTTGSGGLPERVHFGSLIDTDSIYTDERAQAKFVQLAISYLKNPKTNTVFNPQDYSWEATSNLWLENL